jgi:UDP-N-acetylmuramoyl-L-alanyl-D-glutamate--2,6-diaminopimelate ligase
LAEVAARLGVESAVDGAVGGITHDSRLVRPGDVYAALAGAKAHGAIFAAEAVGAGAVAVLTDPAGAALAGDCGVPVLVVAKPRTVLGPIAAFVYGDPSQQLRTFGVTGTNGKTTTAYLLEAGLRAAGCTTGLVGTIETRIGDQAVPSVRTTPEASDLQALLAAMVERGVHAVAMEVSSHALALHRVDGTAFDVAGFTNLSQDHLDFHADLEDYFAAKARLFEPAFAARGVVNADDEHGRRLLAEPHIPLVPVSATGSRDAAWRAFDVVAESGGSSFSVHGPGGQQARLHTALAGAFNVANALVAFAMLVEGGIDATAAAAGIAGLSGVPGRMERVEAGQPFLAMVDFAHTPQAVVTLLETLRATSSGRLIVVLGCGGDRDATKRPAMGAAAARLADVAVFTSDNPRSEDPQLIVQAMLAGAQQVPPASRARVQVELDRSEAIALAVSAAAPGDVVVIAGKGHEQGQEVADAMHPFDDRTVLAARLAERGWAAAASKDPR